MTKKKGKSGRQRKTAPNAPTRKATLLKFLNSTWGAFSVFAVLIGLPGAFFAVLPRMELSLDHLGDAKMPASAFFRATNSGFLTIHDLEFRCGINRIVSDRGSKASGFSTAGFRPVVPSLEPSESTTTMCPMLVEEISGFGVIQQADIEIVASFKNSVVPWRTVRRARFALTLSIDGTYSWIRLASSE